MNASTQLKYNQAMHIRTRRYLCPSEQARRQMILARASPVSPHPPPLLLGSPSLCVFNLACTAPYFPQSWQQFLDVGLEKEHAFGFIFYLINDQLPSPQLHLSLYAISIWRNQFPQPSSNGPRKSKIED
jgi:hypothetical protein